MSTLAFLECGVTLRNVKNMSVDLLFSRLLVLTSRPDTLTVEDIFTIIDILECYLNIYGGSVCNVALIIALFKA